MAVKLSNAAIAWSLSTSSASKDKIHGRVAANHLRMGRAQPIGLVLWLRPWFEFFYRYVVRLGFLDGYPGYVYALISSLYTFIKYAKFKELTSAGKGPA